MPYIESTIIVPGSVQQAYAIAKDMERYPEFMENVQLVKVVEREAERTLTQWITNVDGRKIRWVEQDLFFEAEQRIEYKLLSGDLKKFEGEWRFDPLAEGTKITLTVDFEFGIPMIAGLLNPILKQKTKANCQAMLEGIKGQLLKADVVDIEVS